ncbi:MAG: molybdopterin-binding protein [Finegoldia sp.]|nr:molybdopterin-binding protein [Finegoldia sp.]
MKTIRTQEAVGKVLAHDMTKISSDFKGRAFKKGHVIREEDVEVLLSMGKYHIYALDLAENCLHEDDCAKILRDICINENMTASEVSEGKIEIKADVDGFFRVDRQRLYALNSIDDISIATIVGDIPVKKGQKLAGMRIIPLFTDKTVMDRAKEIGGEKPLLELIEYRKDLKASIVTTGSEVFHGRIEDRFGPVLREKMKNYDVEVVKQQIVDDDLGHIEKAIGEELERGSDIILASGGMSVDPDDMTPKAIKNLGAEVVTYGSPVLPGAMFMLAYKDNTAIVGLPGCVMFNAITVFDIILPYIVAGLRVEKDLFNRLGYGGLCMGCEVCHYPNCQFGKGV